jgi:hypothetical protein
MVHQAHAGCGSREKMSLELPKQPVFTATDWRRVLGAGKKMSKKHFVKEGSQAVSENNSRNFLFCVCVG